MLSLLQSRGAGRRLGAIGAVLLVPALSVGCASDLSKTGEHTLLLTITNIAGTGEDGGSNGILSDVSDGFNNNATISLSLIRKNPNVAQVSNLENVTLERYEVRYFRSDGRNQEGVDVPYRITGPLATQMAAPSGLGSSTASIGVIVVRHQAKLEPPLRNMVGILLVPAPATSGNTPPILPGQGVITTIAEITVWGRSLDGDVLSTSGNLQVVFADFVN